MFVPPAFKSHQCSGKATTFIVCFSCIPTYHLGSLVGSDVLSGWRSLGLEDSPAGSPSWVHLASLGACGTELQAHAPGYAGHPFSPQAGPIAHLPAAPPILCNREHCLVLLPSVATQPPLEDVGGSSQTIRDKGLIKG